MKNLERKTSSLAASSYIANLYGKAEEKAQSMVFENDYQTGNEIQKKIKKETDSNHSDDYKSDLNKIKLLGQVRIGQMEHGGILDTKTAKLLENS